MSMNSSTAPKRNVLATVLGMLGMSGIAGVLVAALITPVIAVAGVAANSTITLFESLPSYLQIQPLQQKTELYANRDGEREKIAEFYSQNRVEVPLDQISPYVPAAAISTEDPRFYEHGGVDVISAARALVVGLVGDDGGGASTITMQYVRNQRVQAAEAILDPVEQQQAYEEATEVSMGRKLQEMRLAIGVEQQYQDKDKILEGYLNIALFGGTVYGIESAAQYYFGKPAADLTLAESATLVGMVQNPNAFRIDYEENLEDSTMRRNYVLMRMEDEGAITTEEYEEAIATEIVPNITPTQHGCMNAEENSQFFCDFVQKTILNDPAFGATYEERLFNFQTKGYQIDTTLDLDLQADVTEVIDANVPQSLDYMDIGAAASVVQPGTGHVLAMQQNKEFDETDAAADDPTLTSVNYNTDYNYGGSSGFQVGSTYKIFTLANWLQSGHSLYETVNAASTSFNLANFQDSCNGPYGGTYTLQNYAGAKYGSMNAIDATRNSINTAYIAMGEKLDQCVTRDIAMSLGAHRADGQENESNVAAILGTNTISPLAMATSVAAIANGGVSCSPIAITKITLRDGTEIAPPESTCEQAISPEVAAGVSHAMESVMNSGTGTASNPGLGPIIGKTGTADNDVQTWMIAATTGVASAVWVGNVQGKTSVANAGHYSTRHVITRAIMNHAIPEYGAEDFPEPPAESLKVENVMVPDVRGMTVSEATSTLEAAGFSVTVGSETNSDEAAGTIAVTNPSPNTRAPEGSTVTIRPSNGKGSDGSSQVEGVPMPSITGMTKDEAVSALSEAGLGDIGVTFKWNGPESGTVSSTTPSAGSNVSPNSEVVIQAE
ncbi:transglycosylase domain-containing protein [Gulosibacter chungangensis]|uniref:PASTA domain-containing protein n=1 Tax=Gulosibacter chungangensis TaxID=979746 RepID=A0A7J5BHF2_9MICO|nr:transglycosylase domain-containing protein [Gulosibacter chungangensis]KAB1644839.1 PASTA domain-containing protein [Gulosibacter chungangensis]